MERPFPPASEFPFTAKLQRLAPELRRELELPEPLGFEPSPDSLTDKRDGFDETGWLYLALHGEGANERARARCPRLTRAAADVPGMVNAGLSLFRPGTHLFPHRGGLRGVLRCHLPLVVPQGDLGLRVGDEQRRWSTDRCLVFDDTLEHEAWNHGEGDRIVLLVTFEPEPAQVRRL